jgi:Uma2 family endonuclease
MTIAYPWSDPERPARKIIYPVRDGKPMGETDAHVDLTIKGKEVLCNFFADRPDVYVSGNNFIYYEEGNPKARVSPDGYIVFGAGMKQRDSYKVWEEGGRLPAVVFEYTSRSTRKEDVTSKFVLYEQVLRVPEYFLFDPKDEYLHPRLQGFRLKGGKYVPIPLEDGRLYSEQLKLFMAADNRALRFYDARTGQVLRTLMEETQARLAEQHRAEQEAERARQETERAEQEASARQAAEQRAAEAEAEIARLRAQLQAMNQSAEGKE